jgi:hypothetical protein
MCIHHGSKKLVHLKLATLRQCLPRAAYVVVQVPRKRRYCVVTKSRRKNVHMRQIESPNIVSAGAGKALINGSKLLIAGGV